MRRKKKHVVDVGSMAEFLNNQQIVLAASHPKSLRACVWVGSKPYYTVYANRTDASVMYDTLEEAVYAYNNI